MRRSFLHGFVRPGMLGATVFMVLGSFSAVAVAERIGFVNMRRAMRECTEGKDAQRKLGEEVSAKEKKLADAREALKSMGEALKKDDPTLSKEDREKRREEIREKYYASEKLAAEFKADLAKKEAAVVRPLSEKLMVVVAAIAQREKLTHVLKAETVLWTESAAMDITNEVIRMANADYQKSKPADAPADAPAK